MSYLPEDVYSPSLLARMLNNLYIDYPERIESLAEHCPRALFVAAFQNTKNKAMKRSVISAITRQAILRANDWCMAEDDARRLRQRRFPIQHHLYA